MKCQNCGEHEANIRYTQIINGVKKELHLCSECADKLGVNDMDLNMPIDFSSFFGEFLENNNTNLFQDYLPEQVRCDQCGMTLEEFIEKGKFGCANCYQVFEPRMKQLLRNIHGTDTHVGRKVNMVPNRNEKTQEQKVDTESKERQEEFSSKLDQLQQELKEAIQVENYERAAEIRDEIKKIEEAKG